MLRAFGMERQGRRAGAQPQRRSEAPVEIMRALMMRPKLLLLDEPMAGLSPSLSASSRTSASSSRRRACRLLLVEHELDTVERLCGKVVVMAQGKGPREGRMAELRTSQEVQDAYVIG